MAYVPINLQVYTAAYSGCLAGIAASGRYLSSAGASQYADSAKVAGAMAQAVDTAWNDATAINQFDQLGIQAACAGVFQDRGPTSVFPNLVQGTWQPIGNQIAALVKAGDTYATGQGITFPAIGGSGSGGGLTWRVLTATGPFLATNGDAIGVRALAAPGTFQLPGAAVANDVHAIAVIDAASAQQGVTVTSGGGLLIEDPNAAGTYGASVVITTPGETLQWTLINGAWKLT